MRSYREAHGTTIVPRRFRAHGVELGEWAAQCRDHYWKGLLSVAQTRDLAAVDGWQWGARPSGSWRQGYEALKSYAAEHATVVIVEPVIIDTIDLQSWSAYQRHAYAMGLLAVGRVELLEQLPGWGWGHQDTWREGWSVIRRYVVDTGHACPKLHIVVDGFPLGQWVSRRRQEYKRGTLAPHRLAALQALPGWQWDLHEHRWRLGFTALEDYVAAHGHAQPPHRETIDGYPVGAWVATQRAIYARGRLAPDRAAELTGLPGWCWRRVRPRD